MDDTHATEQPMSGSERDEVLSARFAQMVLQQANTAMLLLGKTPHPQTGRTLRDIEGARMFIDQMEMIEAKTKGNLTKEEQNLLKQTLLSLHMAFVEVVQSPEPGGAAPAQQPAASENPEKPGEAPVTEPAPDAESKKKFSKKY
ncbi:MAG: DUF1844 domain-containing protein [Verrucomicrobiota bacterium]|jgi:hypothetical protein